MENEIRNYIQRFMEAKGIPGLAVAVVRDGTVMLAEGFGVRSIQSNMPVTHESLFHMASVSKPFVATGVIQLVEKGLVDIYTPVVEYLPYLVLDDVRVAHISVRQMLSHVSGMPDVEDYEWGNPDMQDDALDRYVRSLKDSKLLFEPGSQFAYSNIAYEILGALISRVSGMTFEAYMHEHIFKPLMMQQSTFFTPEVPETLSVTPHSHGFDVQVIPVYPYNRAHAPSSTLHTNAKDICRWMLAYLNGGKLEGVKLLDAESIERMWQPYFRRDEQREVGISWFIGSRQGYKTVGHGGSDDGFRSQLCLLPEKKLGVTVMCNLNPAPLEELEAALLDLLLGVVPERPLKPVLPCLGETYLQKGYAPVQELLSRLKEQTDIYDLSIDPFLSLGFSFSENGKNQTALDIFQLGLSIQPDSSSLHAAFALAYHRMKEKASAMEYLTKALALDAQDRITEYVRRVIEQSN